MTDIEIPFEKDRHGWYRFFEILPGTLSYTILLLPLVLSYVTVTIDYTQVSLAIIFIIVYLLISFTRGIGYSLRAIGGYNNMKRHLKLDWQGLLADVEAGVPTRDVLVRPRWHLANLELRAGNAVQIKPSELYHAVIIATVNESREILEPTIQSVLAANYDHKKLLLIIAYEGRAGQPTEDRVNELLKLYGKEFYAATSAKHPANLPGEIIGKGGNITFAGAALAKLVAKQGIDPARVIVTTLDADNRPNQHYFAAVSYVYSIVRDPIRASYQPLAMFTNNIWDAPALMRVLATGNTLFYIVGTQRAHRSRNFSAHAQSLRALIDMNFWSTRSVVEDGHHFWRSYFFYNGDYRVYPLSIPVYQDAVLTDGYLKTIRAQFVQLRRWTYGVSDVAYVAQKAFRRDSKVPRFDSITKLLVLLEGHVTWATGTILVFGAALVPHLIHPQSFAANELPLIVSRIQKVSIITLLVSIYVCLVTLPPRPARYKRHRSVFMLLQWSLLLVTQIGFAATAAFNSQTRLMFKRYLSKFDVTEKATVTEAGQTISTKADV